MRTSSGFFISLTLCIALAGCSDSTSNNATNNGNNGNNAKDMSSDQSADMGKKGATGDSCTSNSGCESRICQSGVCVSQPEGPFCGKIYCGKTEDCKDNICVPGKACDNLCGGVCCGETQECVSDQCMDACPAGPRCNTDAGAVCCGGEESCIFNACVPLGNACDEQMPCLDRAQYCEPTLSRCIARDANPNTCIYVPPVETFNPVEAFNWTTSMVSPEYDQVMMMPVVGNLTDDDNNQKIDEEDIPDIVFVTFKGSGYNGDGVLRVISGDDGSEHWSSTGLATPFFVRGGTIPAIGDIDGDNVMEIIIQAPDSAGGGFYAIEHDGVIKWHTTGTTQIGSGGPAIANLDGKGAPEIITASEVLSATGDIICKMNKSSSVPAVADVDLDGIQEIIYGAAIVKIKDITATDGSGCEYSTPESNTGGGQVAVANLDADPNPEIVDIRAGSINVLEHDGTVKWTKKIPLDKPRMLTLYQVSDCDEALTGNTCTTRTDCGQNERCVRGSCRLHFACVPGGGPPTIADFDGDGKADIAVAARWYYLVYKTDGTILWAHSTKDFSSAVTGSSVFDFEGDGRAEVVYNDEEFLRVYRGAGAGKDEDGDGYNDPVILLEIPNTSGTLKEYPLIVDVDNDRNAEIVVAANNYSSGPTGTKGIRVFRDAKNNWVQTRRIWNQHTYHVTNIEENGTIPVLELNNWQEGYLNNYRQNSQGAGLFNAPDLTISIKSVRANDCLNSVEITLILENKGSLGVRAGAVQTSLYAGSPAKLIDVFANTKALAPGAMEEFVYKWTPPADLAGKTFDVEVKIDDDGMNGARHNECDEDNNTAKLENTLCEVPQ